MEFADNNNLVFFESPTMEALFDTMDKWQKKNNKPFLSTNIQKDGTTFCCIALTGPTKVVICDGQSFTSPAEARVSHSGSLEVEINR